MRAFGPAPWRAIGKHVGKADLTESLSDQFAKLVHYAKGDAAKPNGLAALSEILGQEPDRIRVFYLGHLPRPLRPHLQQFAGGRAGDG